MKDKFSEQDGCRFSNILKLSPSLSYLEHPQQMLQKKKKKVILTHQKPTFLFYNIILQYQLSHVLSFNYIH